MSAPDDDAKAALLDAVAHSIVACQGRTNRARALDVLETIEAEGWRLTRGDKLSITDMEKAALKMALRSCAKRFREYEQHHRQKPDHEKADRNMSMAVMCEVFAGEP